MATGPVTESERLRAFRAAHAEFVQAFNQGDQDGRPWRDRQFFDRQQALAAAGIDETEAPS